MTAEQEEIYQAAEAYRKTYEASSWGDIHLEHHGNYERLDQLLEKAGLEDVARSQVIGVATGESVDFRSDIATRGLKMIEDLGLWTNKHRFHVTSVRWIPGEKREVSGV